MVIGQALPCPASGRSKTPLASPPQNPTSALGPKGRECSKCRPFSSIPAMRVRLYTRTVAPVHGLSPCFLQHFGSAQSAETHNQIRTRIPHCRANPAMMLRAIHEIPNYYSQRHLNYSHGFQLPAFRNHATPKPQKAPKQPQSMLASRIATPTSSCLPASRTKERRSGCIYPVSPCCGRDMRSRKRQTAQVQLSQAAS